MRARSLAVSLLLTTAVPSWAGSPEQASPFFRTAQFVPPSAATFAARELPRRSPVAAVAPRPRGGALPNQRTGTMRDRAVRDICIGC